ncbi:MAG: serine/threonine-protein kinase [Bacteriovorax sp.]|nr:serine/threonine-protein kinase [Bacteriovorax sp.]
MSESQKRERFGRYLILDHLVDGGMAKICRARFLGEQVDKVVAIKMVQPQYSKDEAFKTMFMDEIKVTFGLLHPNVIQTYDYGLNKGQLFVAMEYCDGRNLKEFLDKLKERKFVFPVEISTYIISQACQGLYYAHTFRDKLTGTEANIIHRDISPHNIMLTYDGAVKIIDFGIAKSKSNSEATQAGTIKGKLSYLAPEYLEGAELDPRYDQFALGITLWEMLCSRKLFKENNDLAVLKKIQECKIPVPSSINPNVPRELDEIVLKALSKDRTKRFDNLDQMNRALMKFLYAKFPDFNSTDLSYFSQELFRDEIKKDREKMFEFGKIDIRPYLDEVKKELEGGTREGVNEAAVAVIDAGLLPKAKEQVLDFGFEAKSKQTQTVKRMGASSASGTKQSMASVDMTSSRIISDLTKSSISTLKPGQTKSSIVKGDGTKTKIIKNELKGSKKKTSSGTVAALFAVVVGSAVYHYFSLRVERAKVRTPVVVAHSIVKDRQPAQINPASDTSYDPAANKGNIVLSHFDKQKMQAFVDGRKMEVDLLSNLKVPLAREFTLRVQIEGRKHFVKVMRVDNTSVLEIEVPEMPAIAYGYVNTSSSCAQGELRFELYGEKRVSPVPMIETFGIGFPLGLDDKGQLISINYQLFFKKRGEDIERKIEITVNREDQVIDLCDQL